MKEQYYYVPKASESVQFIPFIIAVNAIVLMNPYFVWETYSIVLNRAATLMVIAGMSVQCMILLKLKISKRSMALACLLILYYFYIVINSFEFNTILYIKMGGVFLQLIFLQLMPQNIKQKTYQSFVFLFSISLIIPIIMWILLSINCFVPYNELQPESYVKQIESDYYRQYFGAVFLDNHINPYSIFRICGIFDEPGVIGTMAGFILVTEKANLRKKQNWLILIGGFLSFSLAFIALMIVYIVARSLMSVKRYKTKKALLLFGVLIILGCAVVPYSLKSLHIRSYVINKVHRTIGKDARNTDGFKRRYKEFIKSGSIGRYLFGYGYNATALTPESAGSNSYKIQIYDLGFVGMFFLYLIIYSICLDEKRKQRTSIKLLFLIFCLSTYQRIGIFTVANFIILVGGTEYLIYLEGEEDENNYWNYYI